jgi:hypothetical protein
MSSIDVSDESKKYWTQFLNFPQESFEIMINRMLKHSQEDDSFSGDEQMDIEEALQELEDGKAIPHETVMKEFSK